MAAQSVAMTMGGIPTRRQPDAKPPLAGDDLAAAIRKITVAAQELSRSGLNRKAILVLLAHSTKLPMRDCEFVLNSLETLEHQYCKR